MSAGITLRTPNGGSVTLKADDAISTDEIFELSGSGLTGVDKDSFARAWVSFDSLGNITKSFNVESVTRLSTGQYKIVFEKQMDNLDFVVNVGCHGGYLAFSNTGNFDNTVNDVHIGVFNLSNNWQDSPATVTIFGGMNNV